MLAVRPVQCAILRLDPSSSCFTSTHLLFARLCLEARVYRAALPILDKDIYHFPTSSDKVLSTSVQAPLCAHHEFSSSCITISNGLSAKLDYRDHLEYFLYGAMLYMGLETWERALLFLEIVVMAPTNNTPSKIMVEAYKKRVLVGLLLRGRVSPRIAVYWTKSLSFNKLLVSHCRFPELPTPKLLKLIGRLPSHMMRSRTYLSRAIADD